MKEERGAKDLFRRDEGFLDHLGREARSERFRNFHQRVEQGPHPTDELLYEYVWGGLDEQDAGMIRVHIAFCGICAEEVLRLRLVEEELEEKLLTWTKGEARALTSPFPFQRGSTSQEVLFEELAPEFWEPQWAGQLATAADIPEQEHVFRREDGDIKISCFWRGQYRKKPAYISISWNANVTTRSEFRVRFINPETQEELSEVYLGTGLVGEEVFTNEDLGFDPSCEQWAIALIVKEV